MIHWKKFFEFEEENDLFSLKESDLHIWDILRFHVYLDFMWEKQMRHVVKRNMFENLLLSFSRIAYLLRFVLRKGKPNLFFLNSRDKTVDGRYYDKNALEFLKRLYKDAHIIDTHQVGHSKYLYPVSLIHPAPIFNLFFFWLRRDKDYTVLVNLINTSLNLGWTNKRVNWLVSNFRSERFFYSLIFRFKKVKRVYVTQNGLQKALFLAARDCNVETVEFQHGLIDPGHIAYNYPPSIGPHSPIYIPDILLTFSSFWGKDTNYPVKMIVPIGNNEYVQPDIAETGSVKDNKYVGFISGDVFGTKLRDLALDFARLHPEYTILYKLHPNEFLREREYISLFAGYENIRLITDDASSSFSVLSCDAIVLIQSTIAYQALQAGRPLFIYKRMTYYRHSHIFDNPNARLINNAGEIVIPSRPKPKNSQVFFEEFDETAFQRVLNQN